MALTQRCNFEIRQAYLNTDFGLELAVRRLGKTKEEIETLVGRYVKGKRKGELRGVLEWIKVTEGGWVKTGPYDWESMQGRGFVVTAIGATFGYRIVTYRGDIILEGPDCVSRKTWGENTAIDFIPSYERWTMNRNENKQKIG